MLFYQSQLHQHFPTWYFCESKHLKLSKEFVKIDLSKPWNKIKTSWKGRTRGQYVTHWIPHLSLFGVGSSLGGISSCSSLPCILIESRDSPSLNNQSITIERLLLLYIDYAVRQGIKAIHIILFTDDETHATCHNLLTVLLILP